jgi:hypothetical protein
MKAYGLASQAPMDCCPGHSTWAVQSKYTGGHGPRFDRDASRRPFKKRARAMGRAEMAADLLDAELEAAGVEGAFAPFRKRDYVAPEGPFDFFVIAEEAYQAYLRHGSDRCSWCGCYDGCDCLRCEWAYYDNWWYDDRRCWECDNYKDYCSCGYVDVLDAAWVALWVDGKVEKPRDWREQEYEQVCDYDWDADPDYFRDYCDFSVVPPEPAGTEVLVLERQAEKLLAGNRYYLQNRRAA